MTAAEDAYARLQEAERVYSMLTPEARRFHEEEAENLANRNLRNTLIKRRLKKVY